MILHFITHHHHLFHCCCESLISLRSNHKSPGPTDSWLQHHAKPGKEHVPEDDAPEGSQGSRTTPRGRTPSSSTKGSQVSRSRVSRSPSSRSPSSIDRSPSVKSPTPLEASSSRSPSPQRRVGSPGQGLLLPMDQTQSTNTIGAAALGKRQIKCLLTNVVFHSSVPEDSSTLPISPVSPLNPHNH